MSTACQAGTVATGTEDQVAWRADDPVSVDRAQTMIDRAYRSGATVFGGSSATGDLSRLRQEDPIPAHVQIVAPLIGG